MSTTARFTRLVPLSIALLLPSVAAGQESHPLRPYEQKPGEVLTMRTTSVSSTGTITVTEGTRETTGTVRMHRSRDLERTVAGEGAARHVTYRVLGDSTTTTIAFDGKGEPATAVSPLTGMSVVGRLDADRFWRFSLAEGEPTADQAVEMAQFEAYENHSLLPAKPVRLHETWEIDPAFLRHLTERGIGSANVEARARLDTIKQVDGERTAIVTLTVETVATEGTAEEGRGSGATIKASGELHIALDTMLDKKLVLMGGLTTVTVEGATRKRTHLPMSIEVTKTVRR